MRAAQIGADGRFYDAEGRTVGEMSNRERPRSLTGMGQALFPSRVPTRGPAIGPDSRLGQAPPAVTPGTIAIRPLSPAVRELANISAKSARGMTFRRKVIGNWDSEVFLNRVVLPVNDPTAVCFVSFRQAGPGKVWLMKAHAESIATWVLEDEAVLLSDAYLVCDPKLDLTVASLWAMFIPVIDGKPLTDEIGVGTITSMLGIATDLIINGSSSVDDIGDTSTERGRTFADLLIGLEVARANVALALDYAGMSIDCQTLTVKAYSLIFTVAKELVHFIDDTRRRIRETPATDADGCTAIMRTVNRQINKFEYYSYLLRRAELWVAAEGLLDLGVLDPAYDDVNAAITAAVILIKNDPKIRAELEAKNPQLLAAWMAEAEQLASTYQGSTAERLKADVEARRAMGFGADDASITLGIVAQELDINLKLLTQAKAASEATERASILSGLGDLGIGPGTKPKLKPELRKRATLDKEIERIVEEGKKAAEAEKAAIEKAARPPDEAASDRLGKRFQSVISEVSKEVEDFYKSHGRRLVAESIAASKNALRQKKFAEGGVTALEADEYIIDETGAPKLKPVLPEDKDVLKEVDERIKGTEPDELRNLALERIAKAAKSIAEVGRRTAQEIETYGRGEKTIDLSAKLKEYNDAIDVYDSLKAQLKKAKKDLQTLIEKKESADKITAQDKIVKEIEKKYTDLRAAIKELRRAYERAKSNTLTSRMEQLKNLRKELTELAQDISTVASKDSTVIAERFQRLFAIVVGELPSLLWETSAKPTLAVAKGKAYSPVGFAKAFADFTAQSGISGRFGVEILLEYVKKYFPGSPAIKFMKTGQQQVVVVGAQISVLKTVLSEFRGRLALLEIKMTEQGGQLGASDRLEYVAHVRLIRALEEFIEKGGITDRGGIDALKSLLVRYSDAESAGAGAVDVGIAAELLGAIRQARTDAKAKAKADLDYIKERDEFLKLRKSGGQDVDPKEEELLKLYKEQAEALADTVEKTPLDRVQEQLREFEKQILAGQEGKVQLPGTYRELLRTLLDKMENLENASNVYKQFTARWTIRRLFYKGLYLTYFFVALPVAGFAWIGKRGIFASHAWVRGSLLGIGVLLLADWWKLLSGITGPPVLLSIVDLLVSAFTKGKVRILPDKPKDSQLLPELPKDLRPPEADQPFGIWDIALVGLVIGAITVPKVIFPTLSSLIRDSFSLVRDVLLPGRARKGPGRPAGAKAPAGGRGPGRPPGTGKKQEIAAKFVKVQRIYQQAKASGDETRAQDALRRLHRLKAEYEGE